MVTIFWWWWWWGGGGLYDCMSVLYDYMISYLMIWWHDDVMIWWYSHADHHDLTFGTVVNLGASSAVHPTKSWVPRANLVGITRPGSCVGLRSTITEGPLIHNPPKNTWSPFLLLTFPYVRYIFLIKSLKFCGTVFSWLTSFNII